MAKVLPRKKAVTFARADVNPRNSYYPRLMLGDIVRLNSGGPNMRVEFQNSLRDKSGNFHYATCSWNTTQDWDAQLGGGAYCATFDERMLTLVDGKIAKSL